VKVDQGKINAMLNWPRLIKVPFVCWKVVFFLKVIFLESEFLKSELFSDVW